MYKNSNLQDVTPDDLEKLLPDAPADKPRMGRPKGGHRMESPDKPRKRRKKPVLRRSPGAGSYDEVRAFARDRALGLLEEVIRIAKGDGAHPSAASQLKAVQIILDIAGYAHDARAERPDNDRMNALTDKQLKTAFKKMLAPSEEKTPEKTSDLATPH